MLRKSRLKADPCSFLRVVVKSIFLTSEFSLRPINDKLQTNNSSLIFLQLHILLVLHIPSKFPPIQQFSNFNIFQNILCHRAQNLFVLNFENYSYYILSTSVSLASFHCTFSQIKHEE